MSKKVGNLEFVVSSVEKKFSFNDKKGNPSWGQKIFIKKNEQGYRYIMLWKHKENYEDHFKEDDVVIINNMIPGEYNNKIMIYGYENATVEKIIDSHQIYADGIEDILMPKETIQSKDNITSKDYPVKIYTVKVTRAKNFQSVTFGVEFSGTLDEAKREFDILKEEALKGLMTIL